MSNPVKALLHAPLHTCGVCRHLQAQVVEMVMDRIHAADPEDLPVLVRFLLQNATAASAKTVVTTLRDSLHFAAISDPRLPVSHGGGRSGGSMFFGRMQHVAQGDTTPWDG
mgnify:CR=1 FL=1